jgi:hypothetical protein
MQIQITQKQGFNYELGIMSYELILNNSHFQGVMIK